MTELNVKKSPYVVGIDLGTSNSAIAVSIKKRVQVIPISGEKILPSVLCVRNGEPIIGKQARNRLMVDPENTVASIKREMGGTWKKEFESLPGKIYTPTTISSEILAELIKGATESDQVELMGTPTRAVICIPANFNDAQKQATLEAAKLANLEVLYLLEEPVAAAIAYGYEKERKQTILVFDLGGGTFDVSILQVDSTRSDRRKFEILAKEGIAKLGGDDFDHKIMAMAAERFQQTSNIDLLDLDKDQGINKKSLREAQQKLKNASETAKWELSEASTAQIAIANLIQDESGQVHNLEWEITRDEFNESIRLLLEESIEAVKTALASAELSVEDIDRIILAGGSTRVPLVKEMIAEVFGKEPYSDTDPDTVVARGAAIYGANIEGITISNIVTHFLGIETVGDKFSCQIKKDEKIPQDQPLSATKTYFTSQDNQTQIAIRVYQSDRLVKYVQDEEGVTCIGEFFLTGIPAKPQGEEKCEVTFEIDQQNLLTVKAVSSGGEKEIKIQRS
jgi:molecular chaperone DnaK